MPKSVCIQSSNNRQSTSILTGTIGCSPLVSFKRTSITTTQHMLSESTATECRADAYDFMRDPRGRRNITTDAVRANKNDICLDSSSWGYWVSRNAKFCKVKGRAVSEAAVSRQDWVQKCCDLGTRGRAAEPMLHANPPEGGNARLVCTSLKCASLVRYTAPTHRGYPGRLTETRKIRRRVVDDPGEEDDDGADKFWVEESAPEAELT